MISDLVLYHYPVTRSARVLWLLHELGLRERTGDFTIRHVDLLQREHRQPAFLELNPNHAVPFCTFKDCNGEACAMFESCAIVHFLADALAPPGVLAPPVGPTRARAEYERLMWWGGSWLDQLLWQIRQHGVGGILPPGEQDSRVVVRTEEKWRDEIEPQIVAQLAKSGGPYLLGEFSAVDCVIGHCLRWSRAYGLSVSGPPELEAYQQSLFARPAFVETWKDAHTFGSRATGITGDPTAPPLADPSTNAAPRL